MTPEEFMNKLKSKTWSSKGDSTLPIKEFNNYPVNDWRYKLIMDNVQYYPPGNVHIAIDPLDVPRPEYSVPHHGSSIKVPAVVLKGFRMIVTGDEFSGKKLLNSARFIVLGDHAISSPMSINSSKSVVIVVRLYTLPDGRLSMVNELIWSVQTENDQVGSKTFYDIQKWYCCGYP